MTAQEQQMLQELIDRVSKTQLPEKDAQAEGMLQQSLGNNPDALYILSQTVLVQQYALTQAAKQLSDAKAEAASLRAQNEQIRQQAAAPQKHTSFLGSLLGRDDDAPRQAPAPPPPPPASSQAQYAPVPSYNQQGYPPQQGYPQQPGYPPQGGGFGGGFGGGYGAPQGGGFLRSAMQTATGVAAGALAFEGIESLMHGFGRAAGYGSEFGPAFGGGGFGQSGPREEIINNYYGDAKPGEGGSGEHGSQFLPDFNNDNSSQGDSAWSSQATSHEGSRDFSSADGTADTGRDFGGSSGQDFAASSDTDTGDDTSAFDSDSDSGDDAGSFDDGGSGMDDPGSGFDDSGSDFDSGGFDDSSSGGDGF